MTTHPPLRQALTDYLALRRALGFKLKAVGRILDHFVDFLDAQDAGTPTIEQAVTWANQPEHAAQSWRAIRLSAARGFMTYLHSLDSTMAIPPADLIRHGPDRATPYLFTPEQITELLTAAGVLQPPLRAATYQTLIGLLVVTGLRVGEAIGLDTADLDNSAGLLTIRDTKFGKTRQVPLHPSTVAALNDYVNVRDHARRVPVSPALLVSIAGTRLQHSTINLTFQRLTRTAGITRRSAACRPRPHDLRHGFAVATVLDWYHAGADVESMMPYLATYLGHGDPKHTYWYLSAAPELMALAADRLETHLERGQS